MSLIDVCMTVLLRMIKMRFSLSSVETWNRFDGEFDLQAFYWSIVGMFEGPDSLRFRNETLKWWNR